MPRWLFILVALIAYTVVMAGVAFVLKATVPGGIDWLDDHIGSSGTWTLLVGIVIPAAIFGYWPRRPDGSMRRLRSPWD